MPLHSKAKEFSKSGLFAGVKSFAVLEKRITAIPENKGKGEEKYGHPEDKRRGG
jgi:hypothetical protein